MVKVNIGNALMPVLTPLVEAFRDIGAVASKSVAQLTNAITEAGGLVKFWELYGDLVRATFEDMVIVGVRFTGELLKSMITLISAAGRVMWKPIVAGFKVAMVELIQATLPGISVIDAQIKILEKIPGIGDDIAKAWKKVKSPLDNFADSIKDGIIAGGIEETLTALKNETNNLTTAFKDLSGAGGTAVDDIVAAFDKLLANLPKIEEGAKKVKTTINNITDTSATSGLGLVASALADIRAEIEAFGDPSLESSVRRTVDALNELQTPDERLKARLKAIDDEEKAENERIGAMNARQDALAAKEIENIGNIKDTRERATISMLKMSKRKWTQHIGRLSAAWREFTIDLQVSFTDTFADMLSKGEASWETFAKSIKKIVIRHLSEIVVSAAFRALTDLFTISGFNGFATQQPAGSQDATSKFFEDVGEATSEAGRDDRKAPGTVISFPNADIRHMTQAQIEQVVQSQIQPAIRNLQKRGIIPSRI